MFFTLLFRLRHLREAESLVERDVEPGALEALRLHALLVGQRVLPRLPTVHRRRPRTRAELLQFHRLCVHDKEIKLCLNIIRMMFVY